MKTIEVNQQKYSRIFIRARDICLYCKEQYEDVPTRICRSVDELLLALHMWAGKRPKKFAIVRGILL